MAVVVVVLEDDETPSECGCCGIGDSIVGRDAGPFDRAKVWNDGFFLRAEGGSDVRLRTVDDAICLVVPAWFKADDEAAASFVCPLMTTARDAPSSSSSTLANK